MARWFTGEDAAPLGRDRQGPRPEAPAGCTGLLGPCDIVPGFPRFGRWSAMIDFIFGGYTITQRINWLRRREEIREELAREFAEPFLSEGDH